MTPRQKQLDLFFNQLWQVGLWVLVGLLLAIWVGVITKIPLNEQLQQPPAAQTSEQGTSP